jgi:hypothetical protein
MCKEYPPRILYQNQFAENEIEELADASKLLRAAKKAGLGDALKELRLDPGNGALPCYNVYIASAIKYYHDQGKSWPPNLKHMVKNELCKLDSQNPAWLVQVFAL